LPGPAPACYFRRANRRAALGRYAHFSETLPALVRRYLGLTQAELARWLGLSRTLAGHLETGTRAMTPATAAALAPLAAALPPGATGLPDAPGPPAPAALAPPARPLLLRRLRHCRHHAARLRRALQPLEVQAAQAARWAAARPLVLAALPPPTQDPAPGTPGVALAGYRRRWLALRPPALPPDLSARYHLLRLQAEALETEAAALEGLLGS